LSLCGGFLNRPRRLETQGTFRSEAAARGSASAGNQSRETGRCEVETPVDDDTIVGMLVAGLSVVESGFQNDESKRNGRLNPEDCQSPILDQIRMKISI
jgi:hypothetical protein